VPKRGAQFAQKSCKRTKSDRTALKNFKSV
jgi:hypothetical protein